MKQFTAQQKKGVPNSATPDKLMSPRPVITASLTPF
jgi:hypothetical protein